MCKYIGLLFFFVGSGGLLCQQFFSSQERSRFLQEMDQSLLRLHQSISCRNLPVMAALYKESTQCDARLAGYYRIVGTKLKEKEKSYVQPLFMQELTEEILRMTKGEERQLFVQTLCSLFLVESPGEDAEFLAYYEEFKNMQKLDYSTKKERQKVTACSTGMGLLVLLLFLL